MNNRENIQKYGSVYDKLHWDAFKKTMKEMMDLRDNLEQKVNELSQQISNEMDEYNDKRNAFINMMNHMEEFKNDSDNKQRNI